MKLKFAFVCIVALLSIRLWSFHGIPDKFFDALEVAILLPLFYIVLFEYRKTRNQQTAFTNQVILFILVPLISCFAAGFFHDQSIGLSLLILRTNFYWLLYFVLHAFNIPAKKIIHLMIAIGCIWVLLTVVQQYTYPHYYFFTRDESNPDGEFSRAGVFRYMLNHHQYGLFVVLFFYYRFITRKALIDLIIVLIGLVGFYYFGTRQFALAALICMAIASLMQNGVTRLYATLSILVLIIVFLNFKEVLFSDYIEMTQSQLEDDDDIRILAGQFYLFKYWPHWTTYFIGNGFEHFNSPYGKEIINHNEVYRFFRSDVGIIGAFNTFGIFYALNIIWLNVKGLKRKFYSKETKYLKLIFINSLLLLPLSEYYSVPGIGVPFICFILYLVDKSYEQKLSIQNSAFGTEGKSEIITHQITHQEYLL